MIFELNHAQRRNLYQTPPERVYTITVSLDIPGGLPVRQVRNALAQLADVHEALRSRLIDPGGHPRHEVTAAARCEIAVCLIRRMDEIPDITVTDPVPVDPTEHAARATLYTRHGLVRHVMLTVSHLFADGMSQGVLHRDLSALLRGEPIVGADRRRQVSDYADDRLGDVTRRNTEYWQAVLADAPRACTFSGAVRGAEELLRVSRRTDRRIRGEVGEASRELGVSPFAVWAAALSALVGVYTGQHRQVFRSVSANRFDDADAAAVANLAQPVYILVDGEPGDTLRRRAERVLEASLAAHTHGVFDSVALLEWLNERERRRGAVFRPAFDLNFLVHDDGLLPPVGDDVQRCRVTPGRATADLAVQVQPGPTTHVRVTAGEPVWAGRGPGDIAADLFETLRAFGDDPDRVPDDLPISPLVTAARLITGHRSGVAIDPEAQLALLTSVAGVRAADWTTADGRDGLRVLARVAAEACPDELMRAYTERQPWVSGAVVPDGIVVYDAAKGTMR
ncbi:condensation domain-containing protein [Micromonospora inyonensis]|uniref:Condensation domain-containing protein n=1 Tax=Micromonospora inyonensis TaxID=47866 RepID=A0A1C6S759_9ACTN|nr:condensation domain-containing protein [Micromonospora inyonensis]SCL25304.1 Condensation domain-containing protein [Micromonospora inyonensis]